MEPLSGAAGPGRGLRVIHRQGSPDAEDAPQAVALEEEVAQPRREPQRPGRLDEAARRGAPVSLLILSHITPEGYEVFCMENERELRSL